MSRTKHEYTYEDRLRDDKKASDDYDIKHYGTITSDRDPRCQIPQNSSGTSRDRSLVGIRPVSEVKHPWRTRDDIRGMD